MNVEVKSTVTLKIGAHSFDLTKQEARKLLNDLRLELETNEPAKQVRSIFDLDNYPKFGAGDKIDCKSLGPITPGHGIPAGSFGPVIAYGAIPPDGGDKASFLDRRTGARALNVPFDGTVAC